mmetsp:Transcript_33965/g.25055  ORF Transcript_33965/g.25055 Transcript_33965/m.25055 type:complete len:104 (+) Transcript_33965:926-1237(+)
MILAGQVEAVLDLWKKRALFMVKKGMPREEALYLLFEKSVLLKTAASSKQAIVDFDLLVADMAELINAEGHKVIAVKFLEIASHKQPNAAFVKDRIYNSDSTH